MEIRAAAPEDAGHLTKLVNLAGNGMPLYLWKKSAPEGIDPWEHGRRRALDPDVGFNWRNTDLLIIDGEVAGGSAHYPIAVAPEPPSPDTPEMFVPLIELENQAAGSHYINTVAVYEAFRRRGVARALIRHIMKIAAGEGRDLSLIVESENRAAKALYSSMGFEDAATRPIVGGYWGTKSDNFLLMIRKRR